MSDFAQFYGHPSSALGGGLAGSLPRTFRFALGQTVPPAVEPFTVADAKGWLKVDYDDDDAYISGLIRGVRQRAEKFTRRAFVSQQWTMVFDYFPVDESPLVIPKAPVSTVASVTYVLQTGASATLASSAYVVDSYSEPARVALNVGQVWPRSLRSINGGAVNFTAGYGTTPDSVPDGIRDALRVAVTDLYEQREGRDSNGVGVDLPEYVRTMLSSYRVVL